MFQLFEDASEESDVELKTDTDFAKNYNKWRQKEELHKLQMKYGDEELSSSSSSDDDSEAEELNEKFEKDFFKTLSYLKNKDPIIYDTKVEFFEQNRGSAEKKFKKKKLEKPMYIKDYERQLIVEKQGQLSDDDEEQKSKMPSYVEEQNQLKNNLLNALNEVEENDNEDVNWGGLFKTREKTAEEKIKEEEDYKLWFAGRTEHLKNEEVESELKPLKEFWNNPKLDEGEKFLRDYILNKKFLDKEDTNYVPTYDEIIHDSDEGLSEDEKAITKQDEFEHKYNFRFEEPDQDFIKRYPRTLENSLRQKDNKRKIKRLERKERKVKEKQQKNEEIKQLKALKKMEIEEKIKKLKEITGNTDIGFEVNDFEDDFDPEKHDKRMTTLFNDEFYKEPEGEQKPEFPELDEELELEQWDHWHGKEENENNEAEPHCEDEDFNMDCDYDPSNNQVMLIENSKKKKKRRRKSKFSEVISQTKPVFDPNIKSYKEYLDEYYKLDCEDFIDDMPCRFKYREVIPNSFGLSFEEILLAKDKELNRWCSIKKAIQHRPEHVEKYDVIAYQKKGQNVYLKKKYLPSLYVDEQSVEEMPSTSTSHTLTKTEHKKSIKNKDTFGIESSQDSFEDNSKKDSNNSVPVLKSLDGNEKEKLKVTKNKTGRSNICDEDDVNVELLKNHNESENIHLKTKKNKKRSYSQNDQEKTSDHSSSKSKKKKVFIEKSNRNNKSDNIGISDARLTAYGINPKKFKNKLKYQNN